MKFKRMVFRVNSQSHSDRIQKILFDLGYMWGDYLIHDRQGCISTGPAKIICKEDGKMIVSYDSGYYKEEIDVLWLDPSNEETVEIDGQTYRKVDVVQRIQELEPLHYDSD